MNNNSKAYGSLTTLTERQEALITAKRMARAAYNAARAAHHPMPDGPVWFYKDHVAALMAEWGY